MPLITKNFRLNGLANQYAAAVYARVQQNNGGDFSKCRRARKRFR